MIVDELMRKRLLILSGKGGVGKSVVAATLGRLSARAGRRTLLVELDTIETLPKLLDAPPRGTEGVGSIDKNLDSIHIEGRAALEEYLHMVLKSRRFVRRIFRSPLYQYFVNIAPGLKELMAVGKLWDLAQKRLPGSQDPLYELIIVDTPATGHTLSYFRMPKTAAETVRKGFVNREARKVVDLLQSPVKTSFNIVTTPAEMPVNEAVELYGAVRAHLDIPFGCVFVNQVYPPFFAGPDLEAFEGWRREVNEDPAPAAAAPGELTREIEETLRVCADSWRKRRAAQEDQLERLRTGLPEPHVHMPFVFAPQRPARLLDALGRAVQDPQALT